MKLTVDVLTPQSQVYSGEADEVIAPTVNGEIGILPNHIPLLTQILPGELRIKIGNKTQSIAILGGYLEVSGNKVNVLGDYAVRAEDIETAKAEQARQRAMKLKEEKVSQRDLAEIEASLRKSLLELKVARRHRSGKTS
ncbi:MAG: ATP synthase F1 subunit epsilon [Candidatus Levybacteria bacterium RIFCSPLOWO2_01_FULL_39_10]|nr:MAG: ATP synthase F1 subunit epsilon [Candidatus Levybacteria bacterium RIFCSPLOWO2_01_FULL_39_10]